MSIGIKYTHQNSKIAVPIHCAPFISGVNNPSIGIIKQNMKNTPCISSKPFNHLSGFVFIVIANPAKKVDNAIKA